MAYFSPRAQRAAPLRNRVRGGLCAFFHAHNAPPRFVTEYAAACALCLFHHRVAFGFELGAGFPFGEVVVLSDAVSDLEIDPQVIHRGMKLDLPSKAAKKGSIPGVRTPIVIDGWRAASENPAPLLGQHTDEILKEIGEA